MAAKPPADGHFEATFCADSTFDIQSEMVNVCYVIVLVATTFLHVVQFWTFVEIILEPEGNEDEDEVENEH